MPRRTRYALGAPCWADCITPDLSGSRDFYSALFGWEFVTESPDYQLAVLGGEIIGGFGAAPAGMPPGAVWNTYLATKDADDSCTQVGRHGGRVVMPPVPVGANGRLFLAVDPSGVAIGFWEGHRAEGVVLADEPGAICGHELRVPLAATAEAFYGALFGYRLTGDGEFELDGVGQARVVESDQGRPQWLPHLGAHDPADTVHRAVELGARLIRPGREEPPVLRDPWGAEFGVVAAPAGVGGA
ncbi:VOC family protein [Kitasatospora sp. NPDC085464]|uniref:VOC family protein n=1 Tax=Kitasatospora sp. NPDC085464 TaxID=3364063 RepID=UPI0037CA5ABE